MTMGFVTVCNQRSLPQGQMVAFVVENKEVLVVWPQGGEMKAYHGLCPHQQVPLKYGKFNGEKIVCPMHQWTFDGHTGKGLMANGCSLTEYPLRIEDGMVQVEVS